MKLLYDLFDQLYEAQVFSESFCSQTIIQKSVFGFLYNFSIFVVISFRVIDVQYSEFLIIVLYLCSVLSGFSLSSEFWSILRVILSMQHISNSFTDSSSNTASCLSDKELISSQYYMASSEELYSRKCRRHPGPEL